MLKRRSAAALSFGNDERHSVVIIFVLMSAVVLLAAGATLDYARVSNMRQGIEAAVGAASGAGVNALADTSLSDDEVKAAAVSHFEKSMALARQVGTIDAPTVSIDRGAKKVTVVATGIVSMTVSRLRGIDEVTVPATSTAFGATQSPIIP